MKIAIVGLGFVGLTFAAVLASKGYETTGIDSDRKKLSSIKSGKAPFYEPSLEKTLSTANRKSLKISNDIKSTVNNNDLIFITVGTPLSPRGDIDLKNIKSISKSIGQALRSSNNKPIIIVKSTVIPGTTKEVIRKIIEQNSKKKEGHGFYLLTNPEFIREGNAIEDTIKPNKIVIGGDNNYSKFKLKNFYKSLYGRKIPQIITTSQTAELIKYANNSFLATKISFINQIANLCESIEGTNVDDIAQAMGYDPRIGNLFLNAGPGYGGSCLPKDIQALISFSSKLGKNPRLLKSVQQTNYNQIKQLIDRIEKITNAKKRITILGVAFKEDSDDIRESTSINLIRELLKKRYRIIVHDPKAIKNTEKIFKNKIEYAGSISDALKESYCAVLMTPWSQYRKLTNFDFKLMKNKVLIDTRRLLKNSKLKIDYYAIGQGRKPKS